MAVTDVLEVPLSRRGQADSGPVLNRAIAGIAESIAGAHTLTVSGTQDTYSLPYSVSGDLSSRTALRFMVLYIEGNAAQPYSVVHPQKSHLFIVKNDSTQDCTLGTGAGDTITLPASHTQIVYCGPTGFIGVAPATQHSDEGLDERSAVRPPVRLITSNYSISNTDENTIIEVDPSTSSIDLTLPNVAGTPRLGTMMTVTLLNVANVVRIVAPVGVTINGVDGGSCAIEPEAYAGVSLYVGTQGWVVQGKHGSVA